AAKQVAGVIAVLTGEEATRYVKPMAAFCAEPVVQHALAVDRARFVGEGVASVAAPSRYAAGDACAKIGAEYELLPAYEGPHVAMQPDAVKLHDTLDSNVVFARELRFGNVDADFAGAHIVVKRQLRWHRMGAQPIETAGVVASWDPFGQTMTCWSNTNMY